MSKFFPESGQSPKAEIRQLWVWIQNASTPYTCEKMEKQSHCLFWRWFPRTLCETVVGIQQCGMWSLLSRARGTQWPPDSGGGAAAIFKDKRTLKFPSGISLWKLSIGLLQMHRPLPLPMLDYQVNPTFSRSGGIWWGKGWGICKRADKCKAFLESLLGKEAPSQWHLPALQIPQGEGFSLLAWSGCGMCSAPAVKLFTICFCISHRLWAPLHQGWCPLFIPRKWHSMSHVEVSKNWKNVELGHRAWASKSGRPGSSPS